MPAASIVWLRRDLRLADQPAFHAAASAGPVIPVYVLDDDGAGRRKPGGAARWWLHHSLAALERDLDERGSKLILRRGDAAAALAAVARAAGIAAVHALHHYEPWEIAAEKAVAGALDLTLHDGAYLAPPLTVRTGSDKPYRIFTPFWRALGATMPPADPLPRPHLRAPANWPASDGLDDWHLVPTSPDWASGFAKEWRAGEIAAHDQLDDFLHRVGDYEEDRNLPARDGSSRLSPHLHWGEISPGQVWHALAGNRGKGADTFRSELAWRDFAQNLIAQFPDYGDEPYRPEYARLAWRDPMRDAAAAADLKAWQRGRTGYPIVDAGMRQLWATGWMHNRVRMIAASFLVKHLLIDWRHGERWFWDTLVDADYGNNATNWQWIAGSGVDASLFSRIMAPLVQSAKFAAGDYIRHWVPELAKLPDADIHDPADRPRGYPEPLVDHRAARERALAAYRHARAAS
ncbi:cryptochrome/photolyase family protein [Parablastomonas sp. CN1-191]|uniref:cryptochrome/photolyase family protein n=1 Tax=Parablastomonas sp. CN1-191 TaxID=3400908 RepID=UPI003BF8B945